MKQPYSWFLFATVVAALSAGPSLSAQSVALKRVSQHVQTGPSSIMPADLKPFAFEAHLRGGSANMSAWGPALYLPGSGGVPASGASADTNTGTRNFSATPNNFSDYMFIHDFTTVAQMDSAYPVGPAGGGQYGVKFVGSTPPSPSSFTTGMQFSSGSFPSVVPQVVAASNGATWTPRGLRVRAHGITTLTLNTFQEYGTAEAGALTTAGVFDRSGNVIAGASAGGYRAPSLGVNQVPATQVTLDGSLLTPGVEYVLEIQYGVFGSAPDSASLNGTSFVGSSGYYRITRVVVTALSNNAPEWQTDPVWQNARAGQRYLWEMDGLHFMDGVDLGRHEAGWAIAGSGDFNGDGDEDIVWQNVATGQRSLWLMNGKYFSEGVDLGVHDVSWSIAATGDFDGDGHTDLVWQNTRTGQRCLWLMNRTWFREGVDLGVHDLAWSIAGSADFDGDGGSDLVWQNTATGQRCLWLMQGVWFREGIDLGVHDLSWSIAGTGDFDGDGQADLVWENTVTGQRSLWLMNGYWFRAGADLGVHDPMWSIASAGDFDGDGDADILWEFATGVSMATRGQDFNGDGRADIIWQNTATGQRSLWFMDRGQFAGGAEFARVETAWSIVGSGDFNGDGHADLIWQNGTTGARRLWLMERTNLIKTVELGTHDLSWQIAGAGDFNRDGHCDIVWQNISTGACSLWLMNRTAYSAGVDLGIQNTAWRIAAAGDFNGDGHTDLAWQNVTTGSRSLWLMNRTQFSSGVELGVEPLDWHIAGAGDFDGDGLSDLLWENLSTGARHIWLQSGEGEVDLGTQDLRWRIAN